MDEPDDEAITERPQGGPPSRPRGIDSREGGTSTKGPTEDAALRRLPAAESVEDEAKRLRQLRMVVDLTCNVLMQARLPRVEAEELVAAARRRALELFPDKEATYELILAPRFARLMREFTYPRG